LYFTGEEDHVFGVTVLRKKCHI